jgi:hypothetical protein
VRSASSGMDAIDRHEVLRGPSVGIVPIVMRYRVSFSMALVPQLQLWHLHRLVSVQSVGDLHSQVPQVLHFLSHRDAAPIVETH